MMRRTRCGAWAGGLAASLFVWLAAAGNDDQAPVTAAAIESAAADDASMPLPAHEHERLLTAANSIVMSATDDEAFAEGATPTVSPLQQRQIRARSRTRWTWLEDLSNYDAPTILDRVEQRREQRRTRALATPR